MKKFAKNCRKKNRVEVEADDDDGDQNKPIIEIY
jgi:hypothetical protein